MLYILQELFFSVKLHFKTFKCGIQSILLESMLSISHIFWSMFFSDPDPGDRKAPIPPDRGPQNKINPDFRRMWMGVCLLQKSQDS